MMNQATSVTQKVAEGLQQRMKSTKTILEKVTDQVTQVSSQVSERVAEPLANRVADGLQKVVGLVESYDDSASSRPVVYGVSASDQQGDPKTKSSEEQEEETVVVEDDLNVDEAAQEQVPGSAAEEEEKGQKSELAKKIAV